jgi:cysteinyl-tRNA synthetase
LDAPPIKTDFSTSLIEVLSDDLNVSKAYALIDELIASANDALDANPKDKAYRQTLLSSLTTIQTVLGFGEQNPFEYFQFGLNETDKIAIEALIEQRNNAKLAKDFTTSDALRDQLTSMGISIMDTPLGTFWEIKN